MRYFALTLSISALLLAIYNYYNISSDHDGGDELDKILILTGKMAHERAVLTWCAQNHVYINDYAIDSIYQKQNPDALIGVDNNGEIK